MDHLCPECEEAIMVEDDHAFVCPECDYETSDPDNYGGETKWPDVELRRR